MANTEDELRYKIEVETKKAMDALYELFARTKDYQERLDGFLKALNALMGVTALSFEKTVKYMDAYNAKVRKASIATGEIKDLWTGMAQTTFASDAKRAFIGTAEYRSRRCR